MIFPPATYGYFWCFHLPRKTPTHGISKLLPVVLTLRIERFVEPQSVSVQKRRQDVIGAFVCHVEDHVDASDELRKRNRWIAPVEDKIGSMTPEECFCLEHLEGRGAWSEVWGSRLFGVFQLVRALVCGGSAKLCSSLRRVLRCKALQMSGNVLEEQVYFGTLLRTLMFVDPVSSVVRGNSSGRALPLRAPDVSTVNGIRCSTYTLTLWN